MLKITENYVDDKFEQNVIELIPKEKKNTFHRNHILRYGCKIPYLPFHVSDEIPEFLLQVKDFEYNSVSINEYYEGQEIGWHIDHILAGPEIHIISLLNDGILNFRKKNEKKDVFLPRFSLVTISDELRYEWEHHFKATTPRISVVFRNSNFNL